MLLLDLIKSAIVPSSCPPTLVEAWPNCTISKSNHTGKGLMSLLVSMHEWALEHLKHLIDLYGETKGSKVNKRSSSSFGSH